MELDKQKIFPQVIKCSKWFSFKPMMFNCLCQSLVPISVGVAVAALVITTAAGVVMGVVFALWKRNRKGRTDPTF